MRYSVYKNLKVLSDSILEAANHLTNQPSSLGLLADCVDGIEYLKKSIDIKELDLFVSETEKLLNLYENKKDYSENINNIKNIAKQINDYCINKIEYKFKVVFFAELGSKWDSMDSVYKAYMARNDCEVSVVLAPIYRAIRLKDGTTKSDIIYRDYLTDMGIKFISYADYDIKKDMPDLVFTSQPYESVTTETFWAENIAPYTRLVYLPYFTSTGIVDDEQKYVQIQMPMHKLAWRVACQSKSVKEIYSKYSDNKCDNFIDIGLPKWDYVVNMGKRDIKIPKEWEKLRGKHIILRNTHYNLVNPAKYMEGVRAALKRLNGSNIGYIYRFHPMMETMFNVYYSEYKDEWEKLKLEIESSTNFSIDRNETYDAIFEFSDILVTEQSSLISQYLLTKKPVVVMYWHAKERDTKFEENNEEMFIKPTQLYAANDLDEFEVIKNRLFDGDDYEHDKRMELIKEWLPNADGHIGDRLANLLIEEMLKEDGII